MATFVYRPDHPDADELGMVDKSLVFDVFDGSSAPYVISDTMPETKHMATGKYFTSKAAFRAETKATGCIEYGNDPAVMRPRKPVPLDRAKRREDIQRTIYNLRNGKVS